jgi:hypothetical protein
MRHQHAGPRGHGETCKAVSIRFKLFGASGLLPDNAWPPLALWNVCCAKCEMKMIGQSFAARTPRSMTNPRRYESEPETGF